jgi:hypothetical protein
VAEPTEGCGRVVAEPAQVEARRAVAACIALRMLLTRVLVVRRGRTASGGPSALVTPSLSAAEAATTLLIPGDEGVAVGEPRRPLGRNRVRTENC